MVGRIILTVIIVIVGFIAINTIEQKIAPDHASQLVIEQVKNETSGAQVRIEQSAQNWYYPLFGLIMFGFMFWIWASPVKKLWKKFMDPPKEEPTIGIDV